MKLYAHSTRIKANNETKKYEATLYFGIRYSLFLMNSQGAKCLGYFDLMNSVLLKLHIS